MFKNIIGPVQAWLMSQGQCVGCGRVLERKKGDSPLIRVRCICGRIYMYDPVANKFRRALIDEIK